MSVLIFLPLACTLKVAVLASEGSPLAADFSTMKGAGFRLTEDMIEAAISLSLFLLLRLNLSSFADNWAWPGGAGSLQIIPPWKNQSFHVALFVWLKSRYGVVKRYLEIRRVCLKTLSGGEYLRGSNRIEPTVQFTHVYAYKHFRFKPQPHMDRVWKIFGFSLASV